jgi:hypothetical protein
MSLLIFITEPKSWGFSPTQSILDIEFPPHSQGPGLEKVRGFFPFDKLTKEL